MSVLAHAHAELTRAGMLDADADYGGAVGRAVLELVRVFAAQGHSGVSAAMTVAAFTRLAEYKPLTPITSNPAEWMEVSTGLWQSTRQPDLFSTDGGRSCYSVDDPARATVALAADCGEPTPPDSGHTCSPQKEEGAPHFPPTGGSR